MERLSEAVRQVDHVVLECIDSGDDDIQYITASTTLTNSKVNYSFDKLEELGLITVEKPEGRVDRVVDGTRQVFEAPKQAELTELGQRFLEAEDFVESEEYRKLTYDELVEQVRELESRLESLERRLDVFSRQVKNRIFNDS